MIDVAQMFSYAAALGIAAIIPGPGITALLARSISGGAVSGFSFLGGLILGDLLYLSLAVFGLGIIAQFGDFIFTIIQWGSALYLMYLAWQLWVHKPEMVNLERKVSKKDMFSALFSGLTVTLSNPKTIAFYLALIPLMLNIENISAKNWAFVLVPLTILVLVFVGGVYILGAMKIRSLLAKKKAQSVIFKSTSIMMVIAAVALLLK